jgi:hypothetical protein
MASLPSYGMSESLAKKRISVKKIFEQFRCSDGDYTDMLPSPWDSLPEQALCCKEVYAMFAHYLLHDYKQTGNAADGGAGKNLGATTILDYLSVSLNLARNKFEPNGNPETKLFFTCLDKDSNSAPAVWLRGIKRNITRTCFLRSAKSGESMDKSAAPVYLDDVRQMCSVLMKDEKASEAAVRKLIIKSLWQASGRSSEVAWLTWDGLVWDKHFKQVFVEVSASATVTVAIGVTV